MQNNLEDQLVDKINELYITTRQKYIVQYYKVETSENGEKKVKKGYSTKTNDNTENFKPLSDWLVKRHIQEKTTIGVFSAPEISKFLCFDIDVVDVSKRKWTYYLIRQALHNLGIDDKYIHLASSGNKGYHVLIFVQSTLNNIIYLFNIVMRKIKENLPDEIKFNHHSSDEHFGQFEFGKVEMRPTYTQAVKIELSINKFNQDKNTNKCSFLDKDTLEPLDKSYILEIEAMDRDELLLLLETHKDDDDFEVEKKKNEIKNNIKEPHSHKINKNEEETIQHIVDLIQNGLQFEGSRHNSILKIAKYFRYCGHELEECISLLQDWMKWQDTKYYNTPLDEALSECERISRIVYEKEYILFGAIENIKIYKSEMKQLLQIKNKNDKLLLYSMMIHSKRYALNNGEFYMTFKQMEEMCGIGDDGASSSIKRLENKGFVTVVSRNVRREKGYKHKPNRYKVNIEVIEDELILEIDNTSESLDNNELYMRSMIKSFNNDELKQLPTRQFKELRSYRNRFVS